MDPTKPRLVLRIAVIGNRNLPSERKGHLGDRLAQVFDALSESLASLEPGVIKDAARREVTDYYSSSRPLLRLVSGLADGTDQLASTAFLEPPPGCRVDRELAAVLPTAADVYRDRSSITDMPTFQTLLECCRYVIELDGQLPAVDTDAPRSPHDALCRARAFRAQAAVLLHQCDLLIVVLDPSAPARPGGTRETIQRALALGIPVLFLSAVDDAARVIHSIEDLDPTSTTPTFDDALRELCASALAVVADPQTARSGASGGGRPGPASALSEDDVALLEEYFSHAKPAPSTLRSRLWSWFVRRFSRREALGKDVECEPFSTYRVRARDLNYYYIGQYRGAFLLNYILAVVAVALAGLGEWLFAETGGGGHAAPRLWGALLLDFLKLGVVGVMLVNTNAANRGGWNERAINFRYLAERLRAMLYLPRLANLRPPPATVARYASLPLRQSVVDWLFQAILRQAPPDEAIASESGGTRVRGEEPDGPAPSSGVSHRPHILRPDVGTGVQAIPARWLTVQIGYHTKNAETMQRLARFLERLGVWLTLTVVAVVAVEIVLLLGMMAGGPVGAVCTGSLLGWGPMFALLTALFPTAVASMNGVRFQSECDRLADHSTVTIPALTSLKEAAEQLGEKLTHAAKAPETDPGSWILEALELADTCAHVTTDEVAEWSVLYAKEVIGA